MNKGEIFGGWGGGGVTVPYPVPQRVNSEVNLERDVAQR